jgi:hypothetical protein
LEEIAGLCHRRNSNAGDIDGHFESLE